jgi:hypothetical protein
MLALRDLLIAGGLGMILVAVSILLYDLYQEVLYRRALTAPIGEGVVVPPRPENRTAGLGTDSSGVQYCRGAERHRWRARQPDQRDFAGNFISGGAFCRAAGGGRGFVRYARPGLHHGNFGRRKSGGNERCREIATSRCAGERRLDSGTRDHGALPA